MRKLLIVALLLCSTAAQAANRVWITEFLAIKVQAAAPFATMPEVTRQMLDATTGVQTSQPFRSSTRYVRVMCEMLCAIRSDGVAATNSMPLPPFRPEYFGVQPGSTISVILVQ